MKFNIRQNPLILSVTLILGILELILLTFVVYASAQTTQTTQPSKALWTWKSDKSIAVLAFSPDSRVIAVGLDDGRVQTLRASDGIPIWSSTVFTYGVSALLFSPDGQVLASAGGGGSVRLVSSSDGSLIHTMAPQTVGYAIDALVFAADGNILASGGRDGTVRLWHIADGLRGGSLGTADEFYIGKQSFIRFIALDTNAEKMIVGSDTNGVSEWSLVDGHLVTSVQGPKSHVKMMVLSQDREMVATALNGIPEIYLWSSSDGYLREKLEVAINAWSLAFSPDGKLLASGGGTCPNCSEIGNDDTTIRIWQVDTGKEQAKLSGNSLTVRALSWSPNGDLLASGYDDGTVQMWPMK